MLQSHASRVEIQEILIDAEHRGMTLAETARVLAKRENRIRYYGAIFGGFIVGFVCLVVSIAVWSSYQPHLSEVDKDVQKALDDTLQARGWPADRVYRSDTAYSIVAPGDTFAVWKDAHGVTTGTHLHYFLDTATGTWGLKKQRDTLRLEDGINDSGKHPPLLQFYSDVPRNIIGIYCDQKGTLHLVANSVDIAIRKKNCSWVILDSAAIERVRKMCAKIRGESI